MATTETQRDVSAKVREFYQDPAYYSRTRRLTYADTAVVDEDPISVRQMAPTSQTTQAKPMPKATVVKPKAVQQSKPAPKVEEDEPTLLDRLSERWHAFWNPPKTKKKTKKATSKVSRSRTRCDDYDKENDEFDFEEAENRKHKRISIALVILLIVLLILLAFLVSKLF